MDLRALFPSIRSFYHSSIHTFFIPVTFAVGRRTVSVAFSICIFFSFIFIVGSYKTKWKNLSSLKTLLLKEQMGEKIGRCIPGLVGWKRLVEKEKMSQVITVRNKIK